MTDNQQALTTDVICHTPGPWTAERDDDREVYDIGTREGIPVGQRHVCTVSFGYDEPAESEQHANALLITAAPDMYKALRELEEEITSRFGADRDMSPELSKVIFAARAALDKTGHR